MSLSEPARQEMIHATHEAAAAMVNDFDEMRRILAKPDPTPGDLRRTSGLLRRILIDNNGDIRKIAPPRTGRVLLSAPDAGPLIRSNQQDPFLFVSIGAADLFGISVGAVIYERGARARELPGHDSWRTVELSVDGFLNQPVIGIGGAWAKRGDVIRYVANVANGVHSGTVREDSEVLLRRARSMVKLTVEKGIPALVLSTVLEPPAGPFKVNQAEIDCVSLQLFIACRLLTSSPNILTLEEIIRAEQV